MSEFTVRSKNIKIKKFRHSNQKFYIYKYCDSRYVQDQTLCEAYQKFQREYTYMKDLENRMEQENNLEEYRKYFPLYIRCGYSRSGSPYILMEYVEGTTLEEMLAQFPRADSPQDQLTRLQTRHLMDQLRRIQELLYTAGMLQLDLNPRNIIITSRDYDLKMIDFTDACYLREGTSYKRIDDRIDPNLPLARQLQATIADLFTRLFYSGSDCYAHFRSAPRVRPRFFDRYGTLLDCLEQRDFLLLETPRNVNDLHYLDLWYEEFHRHF